MRAKETLAIQASDIVKPGNQALSCVKETYVLGIYIPTFKTGNKQFTLVRNKFAASLSHKKLSKRPNGKMFSVSYGTYLSQVKKAAEFFGIDSQLTPHSARIGGALHDYLSGVDAATIAIHGRWASTKSLEY